jgi:spermidine synthase
LIPSANHKLVALPAIAWKSVVLLFVGSGCAALIYEVVWFHLLRLVIGGSSLSLGILLSSFMGGMCLGSWALARLVPPTIHPLRVYAALELAIGVIGATLPWWLPVVSEWYLSVADESLTGISARAVVAAIAVLPPTVMMGATLPAVARWVKSTPEGLSQLGVFYGANIFGAVLGCLLAGFVLLPTTDTVISSYVAAAINAVVAAIAWLISLWSPYEAVADDGPTLRSDGRPIPGASWAAFLIIALSGFAALGAEVVWTRLLAMLFGSTVYTFAIILAVFLVGLGLGSTLSAKFVKRIHRPFLWLALAQLAVTCLAVYANGIITWFVPYWLPPDVRDTSDAYWVFWHDSLRTALSVLPSAFCWGASFPLALAAAGQGQRDTGRLVGQVYAANTLGAIFGALVASSLLIPSIGSHQAQRALALASASAAVVAMAMTSWRPVAGSSTRPALRAKQAVAADVAPTRYLTSIGVVVVMIVAAAAVRAIAPPPFGLFGRSLHPGLWQHYEHLFEREGRTTSVVVQRHKATGYRFICIGGKVEASNIPPDLRCQRLLGHLAALFHPAPKRTLTVGMGTGTTAGCFVLHPELEENVICEIEPVVPMASRIHFAKENNSVVDNERTTLHFDDARHYLAIADEDEKFDIITSDPINSWIRGAAALYSVEHFERCERRLNPGGIVVQWIPLYEKDLITAKCELATFLSVFPHATLWTSWSDRDGEDLRHDIIAVGQLEPVKLDLAEIERRIRANPAVRAALAEVNLATIPELMAQYAAHSGDVQSWIAGAPLNRDRSLRLEYLAGMSMRLYIADQIFDDMIKHRRYPDDVLVNDERYEREIRRRMERVE